MLTAMDWKRRKAPGRLEVGRIQTQLHRIPDAFASKNGNGDAMA